MARRDAYRDEIRLVQIAYYKWEFLRRNEAYRKDYRDLMARYTDAIKKAHYPSCDYNQDSFSNHLRRLLGELHFRWRVNFMQSPEYWRPLDVLENEVPTSGKKIPVSQKQVRLIVKNPFWNLHGLLILSDTEIVDYDVVRFKSPVIDLRRRWEWLPIAINLAVRPEILKRQLLETIERIQRKQRPYPSDAPIRLNTKTKNTATLKTYLAAWDAMRALRIKGYWNDNFEWTRFQPKSQRFKQKSGIKRKWKKIFPSYNNHKAVPNIRLQKQRVHREDVQIAYKLGWIPDADMSSRHTDRSVIRKIHRAVEQAAFLIVGKGYQRIS